MFSKLISYFLISAAAVFFFFVSSPSFATEEKPASGKIYSSENDVKRLTQEILSFSQGLTQKKLPPAKKIEMMNQRSESFSKSWEELIKSGKAREEDLKNPDSAYSRALQAMTHFILLTKLTAPKNQPPTTEDCKDKKLQIEYDYVPTNNSSIKLSDEDKILEALRKNLCQE